MPEEDLEHLRIGERIGVDIVALSFVRRAEDVTELRKHTRLPLVAKIEKPQAVERAEEIVRATDCVMVARGDLGIEMGIEEVPIVQKQIIALAGALARPSITATQMLDSMVASSRPTRAEVADVANAILDGTDAVMLSQESAVGQYPVEAVEMLAAIAQRTEQTAPYREWNERRVRRDRRDPAYTIAYTADRAAHELGLAALVCPTLSGRSRAADLRPPPDRADLRALARPRDRAPLRADVGRPGGLDAALRGHRGADRRRPPGASSSSAGASPATASGSRRGCRPASRARRRCCRSRRCSALLFRPADLEGIAAGTTTVAFRRWDKPRVKVGSTQKTPVGVVEFTSCAVVDEITIEDARAAGFATPEEVEARMRKTGRVYRVGLRVVGPDPRVALRDTPPDDAVFAALAKWPWARSYLRAIADRPGVRAPDLAESFGRETAAFKRDVRRLKELGLTESLDVGYRLSPRGEAVLRALATGS